MAFHPNTAIAHTGSGAMRPKDKYYDREKSKWTSKEGAEGSQAHGNGANSGDKGEADKSQGNRFSLPYGLCAGLGIDTAGMTPREAWDAYMNATGKSKEQAEDEHWGKSEKTEIPSKTIDNPEKSDKIETKDEVYDFAKKKGFVIEDELFRNIKNPDIVISQMKRIKQLTEEFPLTKSKFRFTAFNNGTAEAYTRYVDKNNATLSLCPSHYNIDFAGQTKKEIESGWSAPCSNENLEYYTVSHEYGHLITYSIIGNRGFDEKCKELRERMIQESALNANRWRTLQTRYKKAREKLIFDLAVKDIVTEILHKAKSFDNGLQIPKTITEKNVISAPLISRYGKTSWIEYIAEAFANGVSGKPTPIGKAAVEVLGKMLKDSKGETEK